MIYVCKNDGDYDGLSNIRLSVLRRLIIETNGLRHWVPEWAAVSLKPLYYCWYMRQWDMYFVKVRSNVSLEPGGDRIDGYRHSADSSNRIGTGRGRLGTGVQGDVKGIQKLQLYSTDDLQD
ncbi:hypothetical protein V6N12_043340 [Hibiscus sabdariffa]|uniref:Uncharacterized protein n=1 Tax=Hibiscus sabdariffa TaxID=183260 RepID=A0ABR2DE17_9ROSI